WNNLFLLRCQRALQRWMPSVCNGQQPFVINLWNDAPELPRKAGLGKAEIQIAQCLNSQPKIFQSFSDTRCEASQNVLDLLLCTFLKTNQFVVQFQSFQGFEKERRTTGTRPMNHPAQFLAILDPDGNHKPFIPKGDDLVLNRMGSGVSLQNLPQCLVQTVPQDIDFVSNTLE